MIGAALAVDLVVVDLVVVDLDFLDVALAAVVDLDSLDVALAAEAFVNLKSGQNYRDRIILLQHMFSLLIATICRAPNLVLTNQQEP